MFQYLLVYLQWILCYGLLSNARFSIFFFLALYTTDLLRLRHLVFVNISAFWGSLSKNETGSGKDFPKSAATVKCGLVTPLSVHIFCSALSLSLALARSLSSILYIFELKRHKIERRQKWHYRNIFKTFTLVHSLKKKIKIKKNNKQRRKKKENVHKRDFDLVRAACTRRPKMILHMPHHCSRAFLCVFK